MDSRSRQDVVVSWSEREKEEEGERQGDKKTVGERNKPTDGQYETNKRKTLLLLTKSDII